MYVILTKMIQDGVVENWAGSFVVVNVAKLRNQTVKNTRQAFQVVDLSEDQKIVGKFRSVKQAHHAAARMNEIKMFEELEQHFANGG